MKRVIAVDLGASSGRLMMVRLEDGKISFDEVHRFPNHIIEKDGHLLWDIDMIFSEIKQGLGKLNEPIASIGVDTWGVDVGFVSKDDTLIYQPFSYRDPHTGAVMDDVHEKVSRQSLFEQTGVEPAAINTLYQLYAIFSTYPDWLDEIDVILTMPNVINFLLTGEKKNEFTHASTTQLLNWRSKGWHEQLMTDVFGQVLPLAPLHETSSLIGLTKDTINEETGISPTKVIQVPGHDTACALAAMPRENNDSAFMSCGTWVLIGIEVDKPIVTKEAYEWGFTNEGTAENTFRLQKNNMGLWLLQQCKREWELVGEGITYEEESDLIGEAQVFRSFIDPDDESFFNPESMTAAIEAFCKRTNQLIPRTKGEFLRCILESLALKYRWVIERIEKLTGQVVPSIHMAGGGIQNTFLCQFTANATQKSVQAGPIEASSLGNALSQFIALGEIKDWDEASQIMSKSFPLESYQSTHSVSWEEAYTRFIKVLS